MKILYICTHNRCRSILSEAITNHFSNAHIEAFSAGSQPVGEVHPLSIKYLKEHDISTDNLVSQSWNEFEDIKPDVVVTVCDSAANEVCPVWFEECIQLHWALSDPSKIEGDENTKEQAFNEAISIIKSRVEKINAIDFSGLKDPVRKENVVKALELI